jgi:Saxitoxin biosynthesis operon protein SxtJ
VAPSNDPDSPASLRRFGLTVGGVFLLLAGISRWRGHSVAPMVLAGAGVFLVVPGLVLPTVLGPVRRVWMRGAVVLGDINARIILTVLYYLVISPIGFVMRRVRDPLDRKMNDGRTSQWIKRQPVAVDRARYEQQF